MSKQTEDTLIGIAVFVICALTIGWIISQAIQNVRTFFDHNIWARWVIIYIFGIIAGILLSFVNRRVINRFDSPLFTKKWFSSIIGFIMCFVFMGNQLDYITNYYSWNIIINIAVLFSVILVILGTFIIFMKYVFN
jgi:hypothetical protein